MRCDNGEDHYQILVEYAHDNPHHYDGISEYHCTTCGRRTGRWCGNKLADGEVEPQFCQGGEHPILPDNVHLNS